MSCLKMYYFRDVLPKWVLPPQKEISCHIFKMAMFSKFFGDLMTHLIREYAGKKIFYFFNVSPLTIVDILLWPFMVFSLYYTIFFQSTLPELFKGQCTQLTIILCCCSFTVSIAILMHVIAALLPAYLKFGINFDASTIHIMAACFPELTIKDGTRLFYHF